LSRAQGDLERTQPSLVLEERIGSESPPRAIPTRAEPTLQADGEAEGAQARSHQDHP
jgi:hypothetical protein